MKIAVTGATGQAGSWTADHFANSGHDVLGLDLNRPRNPPDTIEFRPIDVTDYGSVLEQFLDTRPDAVIHYAGLRSDRGTGSAVFRTNVEGTYNVLDAAGRVGADVIWASSEAAYGRWLSDNPPEYLPIDEAHPTRPSRPYGLSKRTGEQLADGFVRRHNISVTSIRATYIRYPGEYWTGTLDEDDEVAMANTGNLWSYVDIRDVISFIEAALDSPVSGHEAFNVAARDNRAGVPTIRLVESVYGDGPDQCLIDGEESIFSVDKADEVLGWSPVHTWREAAADEPSRPDWFN